MDGISSHAFIDETLVDVLVGNIGRRVRIERDERKWKVGMFVGYFEEVWILGGSVLDTNI